jgi:mandelamide amidase
MRPSTALIELSARAAVSLMRNGDLRAEDYASALLVQAQTRHALNAFRCLDADAVLEAAVLADRQRFSGATLGLLHGLPIPIKDSVNSRALPTSNGTAALRDFRPAADAEILRRLLAQGALLMGKTNLHELSYGWTSNNPTFGAVHNPYDPTRIPGGSSGGAGAVVAARIAPLALAEDTQGSIRVPASMCGVAGLRPSYGRYPGEGLMALTLDRFDQAGPLARHVDDLLLFDSAVTGEDGPCPARHLPGTRIGLPRSMLAGLDPAVAEVIQASCQRLRDAGAILVELDLPDVISLATDVAMTIIGYETLPAVTAYLATYQTGLAFGDLVAQAGLDLQQTLHAVALGTHRPPVAEYQRALQVQALIRLSIEQVHAEFGLAALLFPAILIPAPRIGEDEIVMINGRSVPFWFAMARNTSLGSCASMAGLVLPGGLTTAGLPVGIEFSSPYGTDRALLALGLSLEAALGPIPAPP